MNESSTAVLERQLLLQLGERLRGLRKAHQLSAVAMAQRVGISRTTLAAVEAGDPGPSMGTYLRVMSVLGISGDLALLASDALQPAPAKSAAARSRRARPVVQVSVTADSSHHDVQDLQSLALHEEAVRLLEQQPQLLDRAQATLARWLEGGPSHASALWQEWQGILQRRSWRKVLGRTRRAQELRQASPLLDVLPAAVRERVLVDIGRLKKGVVLGTPQGEAEP
jgi:transcriptional regulator with XRE-family HTH domain